MLLHMEMEIAFAGQALKKLMEHANSANKHV
jgi:hypothetical protein